MRAFCAACAFELLIVVHFFLIRAGVGFGSIIDAKDPTNTKLILAFPTLHDLNSCESGAPTWRPDDVTSSPSQAQP